MSREIWERNQHRVVREVEQVIEMVGKDPLTGKQLLLVIPETSDTYCPFLTSDFKCNIYDDRPYICKKYGDESCRLMMCPYQDRNGKPRTQVATLKILKD